MSWPQFPPSTAALPVRNDFVKSWCLADATAETKSFQLLPGRNQ